MNGTYKLNEGNGIHYFTITQFEKFPAIKHAFSTRYNGISSLPFQSLNLGYFEKDTKENVDKNRELFFKTLSLTQYTLVSPIRTHSDVSVELENGELPPELHADALFTRQPGLILSIQTADCFPVIFYEPYSEVIGIVHVGWKGLLNRICQKTITAVCTQYNAKPKNIIVGIGPGIQQCCYTIKEDVLEQFEKEFSFIDKCVKQNYGSIQFDLLHVLLFQLWELRISHININWIKLCTYCNARHFFSYRREGSTGRLMTVICKTSEPAELAELPEIAEDLAEEEPPSSPGSGPVPIP
jgi:purine-nucleoside/S-methyl-5'-thioadenosine phosphorylase / adenosine deaminase